MIGFNKKLQQAEINGTYTRTEQERTERLQIRWAGYLVVYIMTWAFVLPLNVVQFWGTTTLPHLALRVSCRVGRVCVCVCVCACVRVCVRFVTVSD
jgi:hypothetical protein